MTPQDPCATLSSATRRLAAALVQRDDDGTPARAVELQEAMTEWLDAIDILYRTPAAAELRPFAADIVLRDGGAHAAGGSRKSPPRRPASCR